MNRKILYVCDVQTDEGGKSETLYDNEIKKPVECGMLNLMYAATE